jgi:hypothetical protein
MKRRSRKFPKIAAVLIAMGAAGLGVSVPLMASTFHASAAPKPAITEDVSTAIAQMEKSLRAERFSFRARLLRVYPGANGQPLHIAHSMNITVQRPDRMRVDVTGDDGTVKLVYDGRSVSMLGIETNKYSTIPVPPTIQGMLDTVSGRLDTDFPLSDFLIGAPDKSVLLGVTSGTDQGTALIDGEPCRHLLLTEPPGVEIELWVEKNDRALPRRLIITYRTMSGQPSVIAELSDWNLTAQPSDADFVFQPPKGATLVELKSTSGTVKSKGTRP